MRRLAPVLLSALLAGCATAPRQTYWQHQGVTKPMSNNEKRQQWREFYSAMGTVTNWGTAAVANLGGEHCGGGDFAQSFVAKSKRLTALAIQMCPATDDDIWLRLDLRGDNEGIPDDVFIARSWVRVCQNNQISPEGFIVFQFPDVELVRDRRYWFVLHSYTTCSVKHNYLTNMYLTDQDQYPAGNYMYLGIGLPTRLGTPSSDKDICFVVYSSFDAGPTLTETSEDMFREK